MTTTTQRPLRRIEQREPSAVELPRAAYLVSSALAAAALVVGLATFVFGGLLRGTPVMNGSARGTGRIMFAVGVPCLVASMVLVARGSNRAVFVWFGATLYLGYNAFLQLLGTPMNRLFLLEVAALSLSIASAVAVAAGARVTRLASMCAATMPAHGLAIYLWVMVGLNELAWLARLVPTTVNNETETLLDGTGLSMIPTYLQDLAFWVPLLAVGAWWLWNRKPWGFLLVGGGLAMWAIEGLTVATDQWFGHRADPASTIASDAVVVPFLVATVIGVLALAVFLRHVEERPLDG